MWAKHWDKSQQWDREQIIQKCGTIQIFKNNTTKQNRIHAKSNNKLNSENPS